MTSHLTGMTCTVHYCAWITLCLVSRWNLTYGSVIWWALIVKERTCTQHPLKMDIFDGGTCPEPQWLQCEWQGTVCYSAASRRKNPSEESSIIFDGAYRCSKLRECENLNQARGAENMRFWSMRSPRKALFACPWSWWLRGQVHEKVLFMSGRKTKRAWQSNGHDPT